MHELVSKYGYYSSGESFSIADENEVWIMELIGKGEGEKGAVWVALRIPDGYVSGHANQARITTFPLEMKENSISTKDIDGIFNEDIECVYAEDVVSFAKRKGLYEGEDDKFSFSDVYAPVSQWISFEDSDVPSKNLADVDPIAIDCSDAVDDAYSFGAKLMFSTVQAIVT